MKITIRGNNPITSDDVKRVLDNLSEEIAEDGVIIKNMTLYIRFLNQEGETVDLVNKNGDSISRTVTISAVQKMDKPKKSGKQSPNVIDFEKKKTEKSSEKKDE